MDMEFKEIPLPFYLNCLNEMAISIDHGPGKLEIVDSWKVMISMIGYLNMEAKC